MELKSAATIREDVEALTARLAVAEQELVKTVRNVKSQLATIEASGQELTQALEAYGNTLAVQALTSWQTEEAGRLPRS